MAMPLEHLPLVAKGAMTASAAKAMTLARFILQPKLPALQGGAGSFGSFNMASQDFNYNVGGTNTFLMLPQLPTTTNGLPSWHRI